MHELGIADSILDAVRQEAEAHPGMHVRLVGLRLGEFAGVDPDALSFCFKALVQGSDLAPECGREFVVKDYEFICPICDTWSSDCVAGLEMEIAFMELEEPCSTSL